jgi:hypothetical protein
MNLENLYSKKRKLNIADKKVRVKLANFEKKSQFILRKERAKRLLMLGILVEKAEIDNQPIETILGYLLEYKNISAKQKKSYLVDGKKLFLKKSRSEKTKEVEFSYMTHLEKKERSHKLIGIGALFEIADLDKKDKAALIGYLIQFKKRDLRKKKGYNEAGTRILIKRKNNYKQGDKYEKK